MECIGGHTKNWLRSAPPSFAKERVVKPQHCCNWSRTVIELSRATHPRLERASRIREKKRLKVVLERCIPTRTMACLVTSGLSRGYIHDDHVAAHGAGGPGGGSYSSALTRNSSGFLRHRLHDDMKSSRSSAGNRSNAMVRMGVFPLTEVDRREVKSVIVFCSTRVSYP